MASNSSGKGKGLASSPSGKGMGHVSSSSGKGKGVASSSRDDDGKGKGLRHPMTSKRTNDDTSEHFW
jgi:hypothetical protein